MDSKKAFKMTPNQLDALRLKLAGVSYAEIARRLGYANASTARTAVITAMEKTAESSEDLRDIHHERNERLLLSVWQDALDPRIAPEIRQSAREFALKVLTRDAKLMGLDVPVRIDLYTEIRRWAVTEGIDPDSAINDAEDILRSARAAAQQ